MNKSIMLVMLIFVLSWTQGQCASAADVDETERFVQAINERNRSKIVVLLYSHPLDPTALAGSDLVNNVVRDLCDTLTDGSHISEFSNERRVKKVLSALCRFMNDTFKTTLIKLTDSDSDSPNKGRIPLPLFIADKLVSLVQATKTSQIIKKLLITDFFKSPMMAANGTVISGDGAMTVQQYCKSLEVAWRQSKETEHGELKKPTANDIAAIFAKLPQYNPAAVNVTVISLPTLLQNGDVAALLYKETNDQQDRVWATSCAFYSVFHLVNAWRYKGNAVAMLKSFSRNNFSEFLAMTRSGVDVALSLQKPQVGASETMRGIEKEKQYHEKMITASAADRDKKDFHTKGLADVNGLIAREQYYPTIISDLVVASSRKLGALTSFDTATLAASYAFLSGINESTFHYCPFYVGQKSPIIHRFHKDGVNDMLGYLCDVPSNFVVPLFVHTSGHMSSALVYKFASRPASGGGAGEPHYIVFFTESNRKKGDSDEGDESFNFKTAFSEVFSQLEKCDPRMVHIHGPGKVTTQEVCALIEGVHQKFEAAGGRIFNFEPDAATKARILKDSDPNKLFDVLLYSKNWQGIKQLSALGLSFSMSSFWINLLIDQAVASADNELLIIGLQAMANLHNKKDDTPLMLAVRFYMFKAVQMLLNAGTPVGRQDGHGTTAIHIAAEADNMPMLQLLLKAEQSSKCLHDLDDNNKTALDIAYARKNTEAIALLKKHHALRASELASGRQPQVPEQTSVFSKPKKWLKELMNK